MRIAVLGAGAMGSWFGGHLALGDNVVQLLTTNVAHHEAITKNGLVLKGPSAGSSFGQSFKQLKEQRVKVAASLPKNIQGPVDLVLLMTKTFQITDAIATIESAIDDDTHILSLQNGLGNAEAIAQFVPIERVFDAAC